MYLEDVLNGLYITYTHFYVAVATPADVPINRVAVAQQVINRRGKVIESYDEDTLVSWTFKVTQNSHVN